MLRQSALQHLEVLSSRAEFHGQPPALMLSFEGLESSLLLANDFWSRLEGAVPGELIVGVPARDVVIVTGSQSGPGLEKAKRCVERVFFAGGENLIARGLLVRRGGIVGALRPVGSAQSAGPPSVRHTSTAWASRRGSTRSTRPGRVSVSRCSPQVQTRRRMAPGRQVPVRRRPMHPMAPVAQMGLESTGAHRLGMTGSQAPISAMTGQLHAGVAPARARLPRLRGRGGRGRAVLGRALLRDALLAAPRLALLIAPQSVAPNGVAAHTMVAGPGLAAQRRSVQRGALQQRAVRSPVRPTPVRGTGTSRPRPPYPDDLYSTGSMPRGAYPDYEPGWSRSRRRRRTPPRGVRRRTPRRLRPEFRSGPGRVSPADPASPAGRRPALVLCWR